MTMYATKYATKYAPTKRAATQLISRRVNSYASTLVVAAALGASVTASLAYDENVATHCATDYLTHCKQHMPESPETRYCMEAHRNSLSKQCIKALVDAGEVPKKYLIKQVGDRR